jgi:hypothetical protein
VNSLERFDRPARGVSHVARSAELLTGFAQYGTPFGPEQRTSSRQDQERFALPLGRRSGICSIVGGVVKPPRATESRVTIGRKTTTIYIAPEEEPRPLWVLPVYAASGRRKGEYMGDAIIEWYDDGSASITPFGRIAAI